MDQPQAAHLLAGPSPSAGELAEIYMHHPSLRESVLAHPALSPQLRDWLVEQTSTGAIPAGPPEAAGPAGPGESGESAGLGAPAGHADPVPAPTPGLGQGLGAMSSMPPVPPPPATPGDAEAVSAPDPTPVHAPAPAPTLPDQRAAGASGPTSWQAGAALPTSPTPTLPDSFPAPRPSNTSGPVSPTTGLLQEIVRDDFSTPMTDRLLPLASRILWIFNAIAAASILLFLVITGFKMLNYAPGLGLLLMAIGIIAGPLEWVVYLYLNRLAFELYLNVHLLAQARRKG